MVDRFKAFGVTLVLKALKTAATTLGTNARKSVSLNHNNGIGSTKQTQAVQIVAHVSNDALSDWPGRRMRRFGWGGRLFVGTLLIIRGGPFSGSTNNDDDDDYTSGEE
eukprot:PhF_6_TR40642/c0_g1_i3/m.61023